MKKQGAGSREQGAALACNNIGCAGWEDDRCTNAADHYAVCENKVVHPLQETTNRKLKIPNWIKAIGDLFRLIWWAMCVQPCPCCSSKTVVDWPDTDFCPLCGGDGVVMPATLRKWRSMSQRERSELIGISNLRLRHMEERWAGIPCTNSDCCFHHRKLYEQNCSGLTDGGHPVVATCEGYKPEVAL